MTSLTKTAIIARKVIRYFILAIIFLTIGKVFLSTGIKIYRRFFPAPPPPPTVSFGRLPKLEFPKGQSVEKISFTLETPEGGLPSLPTQAKVYFMPRLSPNLLSLEVTIEKAKGLGFEPQPQKVSETLYRFPHKNAPAMLEINIVTGIFSISYDLSYDSSPIEGIPPAPAVAAASARSYLSSANLLPEDLTGPTKHNFLKIKEGKLVPALGRSESDLIKINLFRKNYNDLPSLSPNPDEANVWFLISGARDRQRQIIATEFHYFPVDESQQATYPIKTAQEAFEQLKTGQAYVVKSPSEGNVVIRRIYLAYYDSGKPAEFFQPIVVFEGDNFLAYVPAVTSDYYGE
jgi:hypothetical protein